MQTDQHLDARTAATVICRCSTVAATIALVGKTITFDSGGLDLKSADGPATLKRLVKQAPLSLMTWAGRPQVAAASDSASQAAAAVGQIALAGAWAEVPESTCCVVHRGRVDFEPFRPSAA